MVWLFYGLLKSSQALIIEDNSLGQRQVAAVIDRVGLPAHVAFPGIRTGFAAAAGLFLAPEGASDFGTGGADVDVGNAAVRADCGEKLFGLTDVLGKDGR